jgi:hypothetical protein
MKMQRFGVDLARALRYISAFEFRAESPFRTPGDFP